MSALARPIILASASPRRREILATLAIPFEARPSFVDETSLQADDDVQFVRKAALAKLHGVLDVLGTSSAFVLAADTVVCVHGQRLGKPINQEDAIGMLSQLAGRDHIVRTAVALGRVGAGALECRVVETRVWFRSASAEELRRYCGSDEGKDKAGAYAVQGLASGFVTRIEGSYTNVVGLPAAEVVEMLLEHGALDRWP